jgi:hypothetical protein
MELLELFTKAIAPQVLTRIFDNIPQYIIFFGFIAIFIVKYLLKWNKVRVEKSELKEARSNEILQEVKLNSLQGKEIIAKVNKLEIEHKEDRENFVKQFKEADNKINDVINRVIKIETKDEINSKQEGAIITMLNRIFNSIEKK